MKKTEVLADWHAQYGKESAISCRLQDAVFVVLVLNEESISPITRRLGANVVESARSGDGKCFALILGTDHWEDCLDTIAEHCETLGFYERFDFSLDSFVSFVAFVRRLRNV